MPELVIVESPGKTKKIGKILGPAFVVKASVGHVRDLPTKSAYGGPLEESVGLSLDGNWMPTWQVMDSKKSVVDGLLRLGRRGPVWLATDLDREGEAIAWHLREILGGDPSRFRRVTFAEITETAVKKAFDEPRALDMELVHAYLARRFLDRVVGYTVSPLLGGKLYAGVSAGRVQSAALGVLCDRDEEIRVFRARAFYGVDVPLRFQGLEDQPIAQLLDAQGSVARFDGRAAAEAERALIASADLALVSAESTDQSQNPKPPFTTSSLQQAASSRLKMSVGDTMAVAQKLYEAGLITYMRSDAVFVAPEAVASARSYLEQAFGPAVLPEKPPSYSGKEGAQEAHEAVRPSDVFRDLSDAGLDAQQGALYNLILRRFLASQMKPAVIQRTDWRLSGGPEADRVLGVRGRVVLDPGWQAVLPPPSSGDDPPVLPAVEDGAYPVWPAGSFSAELAEGWTKPPKRYTEAALIADLEAKGVGRPSTYAATLEKLLQRGYAFIDKRLFFTTPFGRIVDGHLRRNFPRVRDVTYTSTMEEQLDLVAAGSRRYTELLDIYWDGLQRELAAAQADPQLQAPPRPSAPGAACPKCSGGRVLWIRKGVLKLVCRSRSCGDEVELAWAPKRSSARKKKRKESAEEGAVEDAAADLRAGPRCPTCSGAVHRWKAGTSGFVDLCGAWPSCAYFTVAAGPVKRASARKPAGARGGSKRRTTGGRRPAKRRSS